LTGVFFASATAGFFDEDSVVVLCDTVFSGVTFFAGVACPVVNFEVPVFFTGPAASLCAAAVPFAAVFETPFTGAFPATAVFGATFPGTVFVTAAAGFRDASFAKCGAANVGIVATDNTPTPTHA
jgi:hypothetical protein